MIDHIFMLIEPGGPEIYRLAALGLAETYRRIHPGQGTRNICYAFDNLFLELLWVDDYHALRSDAIKRTRLYERSLWRTHGTCPFGIAWRLSPPESPPTIPTWQFALPYLPTGISIPVAIESDDPQQPMMFASPGSTSPVDWPAEKRGRLQHGAGLGAITEIQLTMPADSSPGYALKTIAQNQTPAFRINHPGPYSLQLRITSLFKKPDLQITLPLIA